MAVLEWRWNGRAAVSSWHLSQTTVARGSIFTIIIINYHNYLVDRAPVWPATAQAMAAFGATPG